MILIYVLFALTFSMVLTALFSSRDPQKRGDGLFFGFFAALLVAAWAVKSWFFPIAAAGGHRVWLPVVMLVLFAVMFLSSTVLSAEGSRLRKRVVDYHDFRVDVDAALFDLLLWGFVLIAGIVLLLRLPLF